ncbi:MAG: methyltransferase domain-containing protein [Candidatus Methanofastidiosum sp.]|nr:methyltransferase domain-containing protein [Methanofastidiosum sp.]
MVKHNNKGWGDVWSNIDFDPDLIVERGQKSTFFSLISGVIQKKFGSIDKLNTIELGSGIGTVSLLLALKGSNPTLVDNNEVALQRAKELYNYFKVKPKIRNEDMFNLAMNDESKYDICLSVGLIEHFTGEKRKEAIKAHVQTVKKKGLVIIVVPNKYCFNYRIWMSLAKLIRRWDYGYEEPFSRKELLTLANEIGLKNTQVNGTDFLTSFEHLLIFFKPRIQRALGIKTFPPVQVFPDYKITLLDNHLGKNLHLIGEV